MTTLDNGTLDVVTIGEAMAMFVARETGNLAAAESFIKRAAGAELNVAIGLARLGLKVGWVSRVGDDSFGRFICQMLESEGVDHQRVTKDARYPTGFQLKCKVYDGSDPLVEYFRKGSAASHLSVEDFDISFDPNLRPVLWHSEEEMRQQLNHLAECADWVLPGE